jgi:multimeric flavodoxin WrbA
MIRAAVLYFSKNPKSLLKAAAEALASGIRAQGAQVDLIDGARTRDFKLTGCHYIAVGCDVRSLFKGTLPAELTPALANGGIVAGKKSFAFVSSAMGSGKTLLKLMKALEHEGMIVRFSEILTKPEDALALGQRLKLD